MKYFFTSLFLLILLSLAIGSCKKGCTNPSANNYNASADSDDASCRFCDSVIIDYEFLSAIRIDSRSSSLHYRDTVLGIEVHSALYKYAGNDCERLGKVIECDLSQTLHHFAYA